MTDDECWEIYFALNNDRNIEFLSENKKKELEDAKSLLGISIPLWQLSEKECNQAYRKATFKHHPDKHVNSLPDIKTAAEDAFKRLNPAKKLLIKHLEEIQYKYFFIKLAKSGFDSKLLFIRFKSSNMARYARHNLNYTEAAKVANTLYIELTDAREAFLALDDIEAGKTNFIKACRDAINKARPELEKHRGWSQVFLDLLNVLAFIGTAGIANGVAKYKWDSYRLFTVETDSAKKLRKCDEALDTFEQAASPPAA
jgi:hypothetical protein